MVVEIKKPIHEYFKAYLEVMNSFYHLTKIEMSVLSMILLLHYHNRDKEGAEEQVLSREARNAIRAALKVSEASFNNTVSSMRKKNVLLGHKLNPVLTQHYPTNGKFTITFNFSIA